MDYYLSEDFLIESLKATFCDSDFGIEEVDVHVPIVDLSDFWGHYPSLLKIDLIDWGIYQRFFIDPDDLDELIHQSIFDIVSMYKSRRRMIPRQFEEMYWIYGSIKVAFFEEFSDAVAKEMESEMQQQYLNQTN